MKKLNLDEFLIEDAIITWNNKDYIVTADIPASMIKKFQKLSTVEENDPDTIDLTMNWLKAVLYLKNDDKDVDSFINSLNVTNLTKIATFISEYISECIKSDKKKID